MTLTVAVRLAVMVVVIAPYEGSQRRAKAAGKHRIASSSLPTRDRNATSQTLMWPPMRVVIAPYEGSQLIDSIDNVRRH